MDNGQVLDLQFKGKQFTVDANKNESLGKLKEKIKAAEKIPTKQQVLNYKNTVLKDDKKTMDGLGIKVKCLGWNNFKANKLSNFQDKCELVLNSTLDGDEALIVVDKDAVTDADDSMTDAADEWWITGPMGAKEAKASKDDHSISPHLSIFMLMFPIICLFPSPYVQFPIVLFYCIALYNCHCIVNILFE